MDMSGGNPTPNPVGSTIDTKREQEFRARIASRVQWICLPDEQYEPCGATTAHLPVGVYRLGVDGGTGMPVFTAMHVITDTLIHLPDSASERVLEGIRKFWSARERFAKRGQVFKRGILLFGPAGGGKTSTVFLLIQDLIRLGGIVLMVNQPAIAAVAMTHLRRLEPQRPVIGILEDLDEIVRTHGEGELLALLDGEYQTDNIVFIGTTNFPEKLDQRFINRPSRFDEVIRIGMPSDLARRVYLEANLDDEEQHTFNVDRWVEDTRGLSIAHLRELIVAVTCMDRTYEETITRLAKMKQKPSSTDADESMALMTGNYV